MRKLFSSWWFWILVPGGTVLGAVVWLYKRGKDRQASEAAARAASAAYNADPLAAAEGAAVKAANWAKAFADKLRSSGISGDPTAQALLGLSGAALAPATPPAEVSANAEKAKSLKQKIQDLADAAAAQLSRYRFNHDGGQSEEQEARIQADYQGEISAAQAALALLGPTS